MLTAASANEACNRLRQQVFDLVVTDLKMESDTAGFAVAEFAAKRYPNLKTIIVSAYPKLAVDWRSHGAHAFIQKPTETRELLRVIDALLSRHTASGAP